MSNYDLLNASTEDARAYLLEAPLISDAVSGDFDLTMYVAFLTNAFHHVRYTVPLMMACGARIDPARPRLLAAVREYVDEEIGHEHWILNDLAACGADKELIAESQPNLETDVLVRYVRDYITQTNPLGFFGMVHVLEGTSTSLASATADLVQAQLGLPDAAFSYLRSHGDLDIGHVEFFKTLLEQLTTTEMEHVLIVAERVYHLYGNVLRSVPRLADRGKSPAAIALKASSHGA